MKIEQEKGHSKGQMAEVDKRQAGQQLNALQT